jgi:hypothetical protein
MRGAAGPAPTLAGCVSAIEETYEYMLGYAAQGLPADPASASGNEARVHLTLAAGALAELPAAIAAAGQQTPQFTAFREIVGQDARRALAAIQLVLAQPAISSQLVDNLNASIHLRTLLTDLFLIDEILTPRSPGR